jgi:hypothetical protein
MKRRRRRNKRCIGGREGEGEITGGGGEGGGIGE